MIGIPLGLLFANGAEWVIHKHLLHRMGRKKESIWAFHWTHHRSARKGAMTDGDYQKPLTKPEWNVQSREAAWIAGGAVVFAGFFPVAPFFIGTSMFCAARYIYKHRRAHLDPEWAREHLPWHYDHHMGPNQEANFCVTHPFFDHVMGTRKPYAHTEREARMRDRTSALPEKRSERPLASQLPVEPLQPVSRVGG